MDAATHFRALFEAHYPRVRRFAHHRAVVGADAEDLVAEVFTVAWRRLDDVPEDDPLPWLLAVATNVWRNQARSARRYRAVLRRLPAPEPAPPPPDPPDAELARALAELTSDEREILRLVAWDGLTSRQLALVLAVPEGTARSRLHRARRRLAALLADPQHPPGNGQYAATVPEPEEIPHARD
jgi:RNA polymerase sigma-70 factor (ECF subfamily)